MSEVITEAANEEKPAKRKSSYKTTICDVLKYDEKEKWLDISFNGYGVRLKNVEAFSGENVEVKYKGTIGKPNFECQIKK